MEDHIVRDPARQRRRHSAEFKALVIQACRAPGVSVAAIALHHQLNANLVRRWLSAQKTSFPVTPVPASVTPAIPEFLPLQCTPAAPAQASQEIVVEIHRGPATATVRWPMSASGDCAAWLQGWLR